MSIVKKFSRAISGLVSVVTAETSIRIHMVIGGGVILCSWFLKISRMEFLVVLVVIFSLIVLEGINTILERVIDLAEPRYSPLVREIKDALAGLVLLASIGAFFVGITIFWPYIKAYLEV